MIKASLVHRSRGLLAGLLSCAVLASAPAFARDIENLATLQREIAVAEEVIVSAMRRSLRDSLRLSNVSSDYLARQGALITMDVSASWVSVERNDPDLHISAEIESLSDIPEMVQEIIDQLDIAVTPYAPEELEGLRMLRDEQRELRDERREIYGELRRERRALLRAEADEREEIETVIAGLEEQLRVIEEAESQIDTDIDEQYEILREVRTSSATQDSSAASAMALREAVADAVCNFGSALQTLSSENYLTLKLNKSAETEYFTFRMDQVRACQRGDIDAQELLDQAYAYDR